MRARIDPVGQAGPNSIDTKQLAPWLSVVADTSGLEHAVLSDGWRRIRLDVTAGTLTGCDLVVMHYEISGVEAAMTRVLPLRRILHFCRHQQFARSLFPRDDRIGRWLTVLRAHDALRDGASQREIARALFGDARIDREWRVSADALRSRVRRLVRDAHYFASGGYRLLMRRSEPSS